MAVFYIDSCFLV